MTQTKRYKYQITASLIDPETKETVSSASNFLPDCLAKHYGFKSQIGDSGPTMHAEIACLASLPAGLKSDDGILDVSDPLCPNCMKSVLAAGISEIKIDQRGFDKGVWYNSEDEAGIKRRRYFDDVSLVLAEEAGVPVKAYSKEGDEKLISDVQLGRRQDNNLTIRSIKDPFFELNNEESTSFACAIAEKGEEKFYILAHESYTPGMDDKKAKAIRNGFEKDGFELRYRLMIDPLTHLLAGLARYGLKLRSKTVYVSEIPTSRCIINAVGAGVKNFAFPKALGNENHLVSEKSKTAFAALKELQSKSIIAVQFIQSANIKQFIHQEASAEDLQ